MMQQPYFQDDFVEIRLGDALTLLAEMPAESIQMCCTSPPYFGQRTYAGDQVKVWGGDSQCPHDWAETTEEVNKGNDRKEIFEALGGVKPMKTHATCTLCGVWRGAFGHEPIPELYVCHSIQFLEAIKRVLRKDGICFWNINDTMWGSGCGTNDYRTPASLSLSNPMYQGRRPQNRRQHPVLKPKDLCLIPFRLAIAAQEAGWYVRCDIIWEKTSCMPQSVQDRPTRSHEYIMMFTKSAACYWDKEAVLEPCSELSIKRAARGFNNRAKGDKSGAYWGNQTPNGVDISQGRNIRSVWTFSKDSYSGDHFAVFPEELPRRCILAATPEVGSCSQCGKPWKRVVKREIHGELEDRPYCGDGQLRSNGTPGGQGTQHSTLGQGHKVEKQDMGWRPQCSCGAPTQPAMVLDPFCGTGTTLWVAKSLGRRAIGLDISEEYCEQALERNRQGALALY